MKCQLITPRVQQWLQESQSARLLHLFPEVCNLVNERGDVISLVTPRIGAGPFTLILDGDYISFLDPESPIELNNETGTLTIGGLFVDTGGVSIWQPQPSWRNLRYLSLANLPGPEPVTAVIDIHLQRLLTGIKNDDIKTIQAGAYGLAGRGQGLTPTGDDVLMGVLYGLWVWCPRLEWFDMIVKTAVPRTTTLSAAFLRAAATGEATIHWHHLMNGRADAVAQIRAIGHTSGQEAWTGFVRTGVEILDSVAGGV